ncbi:amidohydrolase [Lentilactobacillus sp. Marseille-Q4993]|uniref:amidohydrolase n=1 Tax=Lentilactobacillus sp. Marseille-Q4993 TaxID=3039492 RepID=UPI0024BC639A|nr:amidohydrolase [Lentilactobacillus sp. Marseille-Q4993]
MQKMISVNEEKIYSDLDNLYDLAETAFDEVNTTEYLANRLSEMGVSFERFDNMTGLIATIGSGNRPFIGIRADIDALRQEYQGKVSVFHSCGHNLHMTAVLALAEYFQANQSGLNGATLKLVFQPAEETVTGAEKVIKSGKLPNLDYMYGLHVCAESEIGNYQAEAIIPSAATRTLWVSITGKTAHAGTPSLGANVIDGFSAINEKIKAIEIDTDLPYEATTTMFQAGESSNIIPDKGKFAIDLRAKNNDLMDILQEKTFSALNSVNENGFTVTVDGNDLSPASIPSEAAIENMELAIKSILGDNGLMTPKYTNGGDDFHFYAYDGLAKETTMLGLGCGLNPGLHVPDMTFDKSAAIRGAQIMIEAVKNTVTNK